MGAPTAGAFAADPQRRIDFAYRANHLREVTGGGETIYRISIRFDVAIDPASLYRTTFGAGAVPAARGFSRTCHRSDKTPSRRRLSRAVAAIYTNAEPALCPDRKSVAGAHVIVEFAHDPDLALALHDNLRSPVPAE